MMNDAKDGSSYAQVACGGVKPEDDGCPED